MNKQLFAIAALGSVLGCGQAEPVAETGSGGAGPEPSPSPTATAMASQSSRDFASLDLCALLPGDAVRKRLGIEFNRDPSASPKDYMSECTYFEQSRGIYVVWVSPETDFELARQFEDLELEPVPGLGDEAYITYSEKERQHSVNVLLRGDLTLGAYGDDKARVLELARMAAERL